MTSNGNLGAVWIAVLAGFDQPLGFADSCGVDEHYVLLFQRWIEEVARRGAGFITAGW